MTSSANFTSKSVFDQQGCRALTFALARLSCFSGCFVAKQYILQQVSKEVNRKLCARNMMIELLILYTDGRTDDIMMQRADQTTCSMIKYS